MHYMKYEKKDICLIIGVNFNAEYIQLLQTTLLSILLNCVCKRYIFEFHVFMPRLNP